MYEYENFFKHPDFLSKIERFSSRACPNVDLTHSIQTQEANKLNLNLMQLNPADPEPNLEMDLVKLHNCRFIHNLSAGVPFLTARSRAHEQPQFFFASDKSQKAKRQSLATSSTKF